MNSFGVTHGGSCQAQFGDNFRVFQNTSGKPLCVWDYSGVAFSKNVYKKPVSNNELKKNRLSDLVVDNNTVYIASNPRNIVVYTKNKQPTLVLTQVSPVSQKKINNKFEKAKAEDVSYYIVTSSSDPSLPSVQVRDVSLTLN